MLFQNQFHRWITQALLLLRNIIRERCLTYRRSQSWSRGYTWKDISIHSADECFSYLSCVEHQDIRGSFYRYPCGGYHCLFLLLLGPLCGIQSILLHREVLLRVFWKKWRLWGNHCLLSWWMAKQAGTLCYWRKRRPNCGVELPHGESEIFFQVILREVGRCFISITQR